MESNVERNVGLLILSLIEKHKLPAGYGLAFCYVVLGGK